MSLCTSKTAFPHLILTAIWELACTYPPFEVCIHSMQATFFHENFHKISQTFCLSNSSASFSFAQQGMASIFSLSSPSFLAASSRPTATSIPALGAPLAAAFPCYGGRPASNRVVAVSAVGEVAAEGNTYLIAGAVAVALIGTAFPLLFSRKDICPECDGAGFIRQSGGTLRANAARKDQSQIVCARCNGLGKLGQIDK